MGCYQATTKTYRVPDSHLALGVTVTCIYTSTLPLVSLLVLILSMWIWALPNLPLLSCGLSKYPEKRWARRSPDRQMLVLIHFIFTVEWQHIQCWSLHHVTCFPCGEMYSPIQAPNLLYILSGASYRTRDQPALHDHKSWRVFFLSYLFPSHWRHMTKCKCAGVMKFLTVFQSAVPKTAQVTLLHFCTSQWRELGLMKRP